MKNKFLLSLVALTQLAFVAELMAQAPVIDRQPYRKLYSRQGEPNGLIFPDPANPQDHPAPKYNFPTLLRDDASSLANAGGIVHLAIEASGPGLTYRWTKGGANIVNIVNGSRVVEGALTPELRIFPLALADVGLYRCVVTNGSGSTTSIPVRLTIIDVFNTTTRIVVPSTSATVTFTVATSVPLTKDVKHQWWKMVGTEPNLSLDTKLVESAAFSGAQKNSLKVKVPDINAAGSYYCVVESYGTYMFSGVNNIIALPTPSSRLVQSGSPMQFTASPVGPANLVSALQYQWNKGGTPLIGEDQNTLTINSATTADSGNYTVTVSHPTLGSAVTSGIAVGTVVDPDERSGVRVFPAGKGATLSVVGINKAQQFQWYKSGIIISNGAKYKGANTAKLGINALNNADAGEYECRTMIGSDEVIYSTQALVVVTAPDSKVVAEGDSLELEALHPYGGSTLVTPADFTYQWFKGKTLLPGQTNKLLTFANAVMSDFGAYSCLVTYTGVPAVLSPPATVTTVNPARRLVNVNAGKKAALSFKKPFSFAGKGVSYRWSKDGIVLTEGAKYVGTAKDSLTINNAALADAGEYECEIYYSSSGSTLTVPMDLVVFSAPEILGLNFDSAIVGGQYSYFVQTSADPLFVPDSFAAKPLPAGLKMNSMTGEISGIPTVSGAFDVAVSVKNKVGTTTEIAQLVVAAYPSHLQGSFVGLINPTDPGEFGEIGGRFDITVTGTGSASGSVTVGPIVRAFAGRITLNGTDPVTATANASFVARAKGQSDLGVDMWFGTNDRITMGTVTGGPIHLPFTAWRNVVPSAGLLGLYNIGLGITTADQGDSAVPQGTGYGSFTLGANGRMVLAGITADDEKVTSSSFVGPDGELMFYQVLYKTVQRGSILGSMTLDGATSGNPIVGVGSWTRPETPTATHRRYKNGFSAVGIEVSGGIYIPGASLLGATEALLICEEGGLDLARLTPNASFNVLSGNALPLRAVTPVDSALPVFTSINVNTGAFAGAFVLQDDNILTPAVNPTELKRTVKFKGLVVPSAGDQVGFGFFLAPQLPTLSPPTTPSNSPELSGNVIFEKTAP